LNSIAFLAYADCPRLRKPQASSRYLVSSYADAVQSHLDWKQTTLSRDATEVSSEIPLHAETVEVTTRVVEGDTVRVNILTHEREHLVDEMLLQENVEVEHVAIGRVISSVPEIIQNGDLTIIPVVEEMVTITKTLVLKEEIHIRKTRNLIPHQETITLRQQEAQITRTER
jgi:stress response protein YsnF